MTTLESLRKANPQLKIYDTKSAQFRRFGRAIQGEQTDAVLNACLSQPLPENGSRYVPSVPEIEAAQGADTLRQLTLGLLDAQLGLCWGHNDRLNALEYHRSSEINLAATDLVLMLGDQRELENGKRLDTRLVETFFVEKGELIEVYATTLHFCPCEVSQKGFVCLVGLPRGTNEAFDAPPPPCGDNALLFRQNKWLVCHERNETLLQKGVYGGLYGENYVLRPID